MAVVLVGIGYVGYDHDLLLPRPLLTFCVFCRVLRIPPFNTLAWREMAPDRSSVSASTVLLHPGLVRHSWIAVYIVEDTPPYTPSLPVSCICVMVYCRVFDAFIMSYGDAKIGLYTTIKLYLLQFLFCLAWSSSILCRLDYFIQTL